MSPGKPARTVNGHLAAVPWVSKRRMALWFCLIAAVLVAAGFVYYRSEAIQIQKEKSDELAAIGKMKIEQLLRWREERTVDIIRLAGSPAVKYLAEEWLRRPDDHGSRKVLQERLRFETGLGFYFQALFGDADEHSLLSFPETVEMETESWNTVKQAWNNFGPVLSELHGAASGRIHMDIAMALRDESRQPLTVAILTADVREFIFPLLKAWPTSSRTAETLLVRREGDEVLCLNDLRHRKDAALFLRFPLTKTTLPAVQAVLGRTGAFLSKDYNGAEVLSDLRPVPGTSWYLVSKVDAAEILTEVRYRAVIVFAVVAILILGVAGLIVYLYQVQRLEERERTEEVLRKSEDRFRTIFEEAPLGVALIDSLTGHIYEVNARFAEIAGRTKAEMTTLDWMSITHPDDMQGDLDNMALLNAGKIPGFNMNKRYRRPDGSYVWISMTIAPITVEDKSHSRHLAMIENITERKRMEDVVRQSAQNWQNTFDALSDAVWLISPENRILQSNKAAQSMFHLKAEEILGRYCYEVMYGTDKPHPECPISRMRNSGHRESAEFLSGGRWLLVTVDPILDPIGSLAGIVHVVTDITERKRMERELVQAKETQFRTLIELLPSKVFLKDRNSVYLSCNENYAKDLKIKPEEIAGKTDYDFFPTHLAEKSRADDKRIMESGKTESREEEYHEISDYLAGSQKSYINIVKAPVRDKAGNVTGLFGLFWDITEQKVLEAEKNRVEALASAAEIKTRFTSMVSHELRSPMAVIKEALNIVLEGMVGNISNGQRDILDTAKRSVDRLGRLINNVLDFQKIESGKMGFDILENDLKEVLTEVYKSMSVLSKRKGLDFRVELEEGLLKAKFDRDRIIQVLTNLMSNAINNTPSGSVTLAAKKENGVAHISVQDAGIGIPAEDIARLFQPFEQVDGSKGKTKGGTGLGLAISKEIVLAHHGKIWAESKVGQGSTFHFTLPLQNVGSVR